jgi:peptidoglycan hydrolase CwlO-like protein
MKTLFGVAIVVALAMVGCADKQKEQALQEQISKLEQERTSAQNLLSARDAYLEGVMKEINTIYADLERARVKEGTLIRKSATAEGATKGENLDTRKQLLDNITDIGTALKENRKRIANLQARLKENQGEIASLQSLIENLKSSLLEREQSIAQLQARVQGLEVTLLEKTATLAEKETQLENQNRRMNTVYYVAATREELEEKGIIKEEGGFLWGLLGSTTVMESGVSAADFTPLDRTKEQTLQISGKIAEILPHRNQDLFAMSEVGENGSELKILRPEKFWQDNYLVVVLD